MLFENFLKELEKEVEAKESKIKPEVKKKVVEEITNLNKDFQAFEKHNPVGAPSQKHGKRGKPSRMDQSV